MASPNWVGRIAQATSPRYWEAHEIPNVMMIYGNSLRVRLDWTYYLLMKYAISLAFNPWSKSAMRVGYVLCFPLHNPHHESWWGFSYPLKITIAPERSAVGMLLAYKYRPPLYVSPPAAIANDAIDSVMLTLSATATDEFATVALYP